MVMTVMIIFPTTLAYPKYLYQQTQKSNKVCMSDPVNHVHKTYPCLAANVCSIYKSPATSLAYGSYHILCILTSQRQRNRTQGILVTYTLENINMNKTGNNCLKNTSRIINQPYLSHYVITHYNIEKYNREVNRSFAKNPAELSTEMPCHNVTQLQRGGFGRKWLRRQGRDADGGNCTRTTCLY